VALRLAVATGVVLTALAGANGAAAAPSPGLLALVGDATIATGVRYAARDSAGNSLDTLKIVGASSQLYVGVYHSDVGGRYVVKVATSKDVLTWKYAADLDTDASQPTVQKLANAAFLLVYEKESAGQHWLRFRYYKNLSALLAGSYQQQADGPPLLSPIEGTPSITSVSLSPDILHSAIAVGLHYNTAAGDREATGTLTNFKTWTDSTSAQLNSLFTSLGLQGNFGDRDTGAVQGTSLELVEGQSLAGDWGSWRVYDYDTQSQTLSQVPVRTAGGSVAFGNPTLTAITAPNGKAAVVVTYFVFSEGSAPGEAGELIFYKTL
jgi:hypothetical protein